MSIALSCWTNWLDRGLRVAMGGVLLAGWGLAVGCASRTVDGEGMDGQPYRVVKTFGDEVPTAVAVSGRGRTFVGFASGNGRGEKLVELDGRGETTPYPSASWNDWRGGQGGAALRGLIDVRGVWIDTNETLWVMDSGSLGGRVVPGGPKLMQVDLTADEVVEVFYLPVGDGIGRWSEMTDVRVDGARRVAYFLDATRGAVVVYDMDERSTWSQAIGEPARSAGAGGALELAGMGDWLYVSDPAGGGVKVLPTAVLRERRPTGAKEDEIAQTLASTGGAVEGLWLDGEGRLFMLRPADGTLLVRGTDRRVREALREPLLERGRRVAADHRGRLFVTVSPVGVMGWDEVRGTWEGALIELTTGRSAARVGNVVAPMTLGPTWPKPKDLMRRTDRLAEKAVRDARPMADEGVAPAPVAEYPPAGISENGVLVEAPVESAGTRTAEADAEAKRTGFGGERRAVDDGIELPAARRELGEDGKRRSEAVAGVPVE